MFLIILITLILIIVIIGIYIFKINPLYGNTLTMYLNPISATGLSLSNVQQTSMTISWTLDAGYHQIIWWNNSTPNNKNTTSTMYNVNTYTFTGLTPNTGYSFEITTKGLFQTITSYIVGTTTPSPFFPTWKIGTIQLHYIG